MEQTDEVRDRLPRLETLEGLTALDRVAIGTDTVDISGDEIDLRLSYPDTKYMLTYKGVGFGAIGGIQFVTGHQKNGKTFFFAQLMAAILNPDCKRMEEYMPELRYNDELRAETAKPTVLYIDTEQEKENTVKVARRVHWLCGWELTEPNERFHVIWLRAEDSNTTRWLKTKAAILKYRPNAVFLDGIRDVINDFNDLKESAKIIDECMVMSTYLQCTLWSVLHENPGSEKMRGHLGTEAANKASDVFRVVKKKTASGVTFDVEQVDARGKDVERWTYEITDDAGRLGVPKMIGVSAAQATGLKAGKLKDEEVDRLSRAIRIALPIGISLSKKRMEKALKDTCRYGTNKVRLFIDDLIAGGWLKEMPGSTWAIDENNFGKHTEELGFSDELPFPE